MLTIRTSKCNTIIKKPSSALFLWFHNPKGWFVGDAEVILAPSGAFVETGFAEVDQISNDKSAFGMCCPWNTVQPRSTGLACWNRHARKIGFRTEQLEPLPLQSPGN